ncbi:NEDD4 family-interacting protein 1-like isoform X1 [Mobula birostris]|uniref:NEDD4 family-interacting protein 1-like isoform X1 n=2 Tax=Mobula birostris TaxID=1983395 RepID=UPI003B289A3C
MSEVDIELTGKMQFQACRLFSMPIKMLCLSIQCMIFIHKPAGQETTGQKKETVAFIFNWIGFFLTFCSTNTIAGRYGAISGFGLSLIKWILIVRFSDYFFGYFEGKLWLWWSFLAVGILLFTNGFINYAKARKVASKIASLKKSKFLFIF